MTISVEGLFTMTKDTTMAVDVLEIPPDLVIILYHVSQICTYLFETFFEKFLLFKNQLERRSRKTIKGDTS